MIKYQCSVDHQESVRGVSGTYMLKVVLGKTISSGNLILLGLKNRNKKIEILIHDKLKV